MFHRTEKTTVPPLSQTMKLCQKTALPEPPAFLSDIEASPSCPVVNKKAQHLRNGAERMTKIIAQQKENAAESCGKLDKVMRYGCAAVIGIAAAAAAPELLLVAGATAIAGAAVAWVKDTNDKKLDMAQEAVTICTDATKDKGEKIEASKTLARTSRYLGFFEGSKRSGKRIMMMFVGNISTVVDCLITAFESKDDFGKPKGQARIDERFQSAYAEMKLGLDLRNKYYPAEAPAATEQHPMPAAA